MSYYNFQVRVRHHFVYAPSQWEMMLQCNVCHWLGAYWVIHKLITEVEILHITKAKHRITNVGYRSHLELAISVKIPYTYTSYLALMDEPWPMGVSISTLRPRQNGRHFANDMFKCIFLNENVWIPIEISLKFVPKGSINNNPALFQIMAWRRLGDKPLSETMMVS